MEDLLQYGKSSGNKDLLQYGESSVNEDLLQYGSKTLTSAPIQPVFDEEYANSWGNRFAIGIDNMQASLFKGIDLFGSMIQDIEPEAAQGLRAYAQKGVIKNQIEAASKPQPTRSSSISEVKGEIDKDIKEDDFFGAAQRALLFIKDVSADALPSMIPTLTGFAARRVAAPAAATLGSAASIANKYITPFTPGYLQSSGAVYEEARELGANDADAKKAALSGGIAMTALEVLGTAYALKSLTKEAGESYVTKTFGKFTGTDNVKDAIKQAKEITKDPKIFLKRNLGLEAAKGAGKGLTGEGLTEGGQELLQIMSAGLAADKGFNPYDEAEFVNRIIDQAAMGAVAGKIVGTASGTLSNLQHRDLVNRTEQRMKEIADLEKASADLTDDQLRTFITDKRDAYKPQGIIDNILRGSLAPLNHMARKSKEGYAIYNALANYYNNVSSDVGKYAEPLDRALEPLKRSIKAPLIMANISQKKNKELYNMLQYGQESSNPEVRQAAKIIREEILGMPTQKEIRITKDDLDIALKQNQQELKTINEGKQTGKLDIGYERSLKNKYTKLLDTYKTNMQLVINDIRTDRALNNEQKTQEIEYERDKQLKKLHSTEDYRALQDEIVVKADGTGLYGALNQSEIGLAFYKNYFPRVYNFGLLDVIGKKVGLGKIARARRILEGQGLSSADVDAILENIRDNDGVYVPETNITELDILLDARDNTKTTEESKASIERRREIKPETFQKLEQAGLVETNVKKILDKYILQAVQRDNVRKVKQIVDPALKALQQRKGIDIGEVDRVKDIYQAIQNRYKSIQSEKFKKAMRFYLTYQYILTLPLAALTALSEPLIILSRTNARHVLPATIKALTNTYRQAVRSVLPKFKKSETEKAFMSILQGYDGTLADRLGDIAGIDVARKVTDNFFKITFLTQITQFSRDIAFQAMSRQLQEDILNIKNANVSNKDSAKLSRKYLESKKRLSELGLTEFNLGLTKQKRTEVDVEVKGKKKKVKKEKVEFENNTEISDAVAWAQEDRNFSGFKAPDIIRKALSKGVDDIIMAPNVINRPLWMSDPRLSLVAQLKGFMYSFGINVGARFYREVIKPLYKGRIPTSEGFKYGIALGMIIAASMAIKELKDEIRYGDEDSNWKQASGSDRLIQAIISTNVLGGITGLYEAMGSNKYGVSPIEALLGPAPIHMSKMIQALNQLGLPGGEGNPRAMSTWIARSLPGVAAIDPTRVSEISDVIDKYLDNNYVG